MRVIRSLVIALAVLLVVAAIAVAALLSPYGLHAVRDELTAWLSERLGHEVRIDGELSLRVGSRLQVAATGVHVANPAWASRPELLFADRVLIEVDTASFLSRARTLIVTEIAIEGLDLALERTPAGEQNWDFAWQGASDESYWLTAFPYVIERIGMPGAHIQFSGPRLARPLDLRLMEFTQQRSTGDMLELSVRGQANETDLNFTGQIGPFENLLTAKGFRVSAQGNLGELTLAGRARIDDLARPVESEANLELRGPDAAYVASTLGVKNLGSGPFSLALQVSPSPDSAGIRGTLTGQMGEFEIAVDGELAEPTAMGRLSLHTQISGPDVSLLAGLLGVDVLPPERFRLAATVRRTGELVQIDQATLALPDSAFDMQGSIRRVDSLAGNDLTIHVSAADVAKFRTLLNLPGIATGPFDLTVNLRQSSEGTDLIDLAAKTALVSGSASGSLGAYPDYFDTHLRFAISGDDFAPIARTIGLRAGARGRYTGQGTLDWTQAGPVLHKSTLTVSQDTLKLDGLIGRKPGVNTDVQIELQGTSLASVGEMLARSGLPTKPYKIAGRVRLQPSGTWLDGFDVVAAGAHLQLSGTLGRRPALRGTALTFTVEGEALAPFAQLALGVALPAGPFRADGSLSYGDARLGLQNVSVSVAGSNSVITGDFAAPLNSAVGGKPNRFDVRSSGPDLAALVRDLPNQDAARQKFALQARGSWSGDRWTFETLQVDTPAVFVGAQGRIDQAPDYSATAMNIELRSPNLAQAGELFGFDLPSQPLQLNASLSGTPTTFRLTRLTGHLGETDFTGQAGLDLTAKPDIDLQLQSDVLDLTPFVRAPQETNHLPTAAVTATRVIPDIRLPLELLDRITGRATIQSTTTRFFDSTYDDLTMSIVLRDGRLTVDPLAFGSVAGKLTGRITVGPPTAPGNVTLAATGDQIRLSVVPGIHAVAVASEYRIQVDLAASGDNVRALAATLDGRIRLVGSGGRVPSTNLNVLTSDFMSELLRTLNPMSKRQPYTDVICQVYMLEATNGIISTDPAIAIRTKDLDMVSGGSVNLITEAIDFNFKTAARGGLGFSAAGLVNPYVKVSGTLAKPRLTVDPTGTLVYGGAALATGGLSILATTVWDRVSRQKDPCAAAVQEADQRSNTRKKWW